MSDTRFRLEIGLDPETLEVLRGILEVAAAEKATTEKAETKKAPAETKPTEPDPFEEDTKTYARSDVKKALQDYAGKHDKAAAIKIIKEVGGAEALSQIPEDKFAAVVAACNG